MAKFQKIPEGIIDVKLGVGFRFVGFGGFDGGGGGGLEVFDVAFAVVAVVVAASTSTCLTDNLATISEIHASLLLFVFAG